jgi:hypothetical protein
MIYPKTPLLFRSRTDARREQMSAAARTGDRFHHRTPPLWWRPDKAPHQCLMDQPPVEPCGETGVYAA